MTRSALRRGCKLCGLIRTMQGRGLCGYCWRFLKSMGRLDEYPMLPKGDTTNRNPLSKPEASLCAGCPISNRPDWNGYEHCSGTCIQSAAYSHSGVHESRYSALLTESNGESEW